MRPGRRFGVSIPFLVASGLLPLAASAQCTSHVADALIQARYSGCRSKGLISYLHNNIITPYSFTCAKRIVQVCKDEDCGNPQAPEDKQYCEGRYVSILDQCLDQVEGAAKMARCTDSKTWPVAAVPVPIGPPPPTETDPVVDIPLELPTTISAPATASPAVQTRRGTVRRFQRVTEVIRSSQSVNQPSTLSRPSLSAP